MIAVTAVTAATAIVALCATIAVCAVVAMIATKAVIAIIAVTAIKTIPAQTVAGIVFRLTGDACSITCVAGQAHVILPLYAGIEVQCFHCTLF